jgi:pilus assembly protein CpaB
MKILDIAKRHRNLVMFVAALALGVAAAIGARGYISEQVAIERERVLPRQQMVTVVVAKRDLARGESVSEETMALRQIPADLVPGSAVLPDRFDAYLGASLTLAMRAGEPLLASALQGADPSTFSAKVKAGIRAITVAVDEVNSMSGMLQPGDRIDLLLSVRVSGASVAPLAQEVTRPLMQDLRVLATGRQVRPGHDERAQRSFTTITVEVSPVQAQKLVVAQRIGKLTATLRNPLDRGAIDPRPMDVYGLLGLTPASAPSPQAVPKARGPEIIIGGQRPLLSASQASSAIATTPLVAPKLESALETTLPAKSASRPESSAQRPEARVDSLLRRPGENH